MLSALVVAVLAVALGAALTAVSGARPVVLGLLRTFAAMAAAAVVATHLLPEALSSVGLWGGAAFLVGLIAPHSLHLLTEKLALRKSGLSPARVALEAGFIGLLLHHVGDGLGIGAYAALPGGVLGHLDVIVALIAHTVPLVAVVTLAYRGEYGLAVALRRALALAIASALGVVISFVVPSAALASAAGWVGALVGGVLMHIVTHDWLEDLPTTEPARVADLLAAGLGLSLVLLGGHEPGHGAAALELLYGARAVAERGAPFLLLALVLSFSLGDRVKKELENLGQSLPLLLARRLGFALGAEGLALGLSTYGVAWTLGATLATTVVPLVAGAVALLAITLAGENEPKRASERLAHSEETSGDRFQRFDRATALWLVSVALFAIFSASLPGSALYDSLAGPGELLTSALVGALVGSGGPAVVALSSLTEKGLSPGAALVAVALSSALGFKVLLGLGRALGARGLIPVVVWLACLTGAIGLGLNQVTPIPSPIAFPELVGKGALVALLALVLVRAQRVGVRRWLAGWLGSSGHEHHGAHHGGAHTHDHPHSSASPNGSAATTRSPEASGPSAEA